MVRLDLTLGYRIEKFLKGQENLTISKGSLGISEGVMKRNGKISEGLLVMEPHQKVFPSGIKVV